MMRPASLAVLAFVTAAAALPAWAAADPTAPALGRLFYTPERRVQLDRQRQFNIRQTQTIEGSVLSLDGVVARSSGKSTVWINRRAQDETDADRTGIAAQPDGARPGRVRLAPSEDAAIELRVGEAINRGTGERTDRLGGGTVAPARR